MSTPKQHTPVQRALDEYSLAVQKHRQVVAQLHASLDPHCLTASNIAETFLPSNVLPAKSAATVSAKETTPEIPGNSEPMAAISGHRHGGMDSTMFTYGEVKLLLCVASASPDAAHICARRIRQIKSHAVTPENIKDVLRTVIRLVEGGGSGKGGEGELEEA
ncbi:hypothetical protein FN846DRAFT_912294 [Sphaerosporella brunnea]|uniref:Uncharacterized protein n=1 Tax=Sphaerosporella brunnea TaxID=1250544 RepID=A0A5J5EGX8_9PEZI|nr:hypothetical protein FN846DRAFT_912294 [Sphaerosporella brunnea]